MGIDLARTRTVSAVRHPNFRRYWGGAGRPPSVGPVGGAARPRVAARTAVFFRGSGISGPPIGGLIYAAAGPAAAFLANAVSYLAVIYPLAMMRLQPRPEEGPRPGLWADLRGGRVDVWRPA